MTIFQRSPVRNDLWFFVYLARRMKAYSNCTVATMAIFLSIAFISPLAQSETCEVVPYLPNVKLTKPYEGECRSNVANGKGTYTISHNVTPAGSSTSIEYTRVVTGNFVDGKLQGIGVVESSSTDGFVRSEGTFSGNVRSGFSKTQGPGNAGSEGDYKDGRMWNGWSRRVDNTGLVYGYRLRDGKQVSLCRSDGKGELNCSPNERIALIGGAGAETTRVTEGPRTQSPKQGGNASKPSGAGAGSMDWLLHINDPNYDIQKNQATAAAKPNKVPTDGSGPATSEEVIQACKSTIEQNAILNSYRIQSYDLVSFLPATPAAEISGQLALLTKGKVSPTKIYYSKNNGTKVYDTFYVWKDPFGEIKCMHS